MDDPNLFVLALESAVKRHLREDVDDGFHVYEVGRYYPHTIGFCPLRYYYVYRYAGTVDLSDEDVNVTAAGRIVHDILQAPLRRLGYELEKEVSFEVSPGITILGRVDAYWPGGRLRGSDRLISEFVRVLGSRDLPPHVIEIKSVRSKSLPYRPYEKHVFQLNTYLGMTGADFGVLVYVSRSNFARRYFVVEPDPAMFSRALDWVKSLHESLVSGKPPEPAPVAEWECEKCPLRGVCTYHRQAQIVDFSSGFSEAPPTYIKRGL